MPVRDTFLWHIASRILSLIELSWTLLWTQSCPIILVGSRRSYFLPWWWKSYISDLQSRWFDELILVVNETRGQLLDLRQIGARGKKTTKWSTWCRASRTTPSSAWRTAAATWDGRWMSFRSCGQQKYLSNVTNYSQPLTFALKWDRHGSSTKDFYLLLRASCYFLVLV